MANVQTRNCPTGHADKWLMNKLEFVRLAMLTNGKCTNQNLSPWPCWSMANVQTRICPTGHANTRYMHKPEPFLENEGQKNPWNVEVEKVPLILVRRSGLVLIKEIRKKIRHLVDFAVSLEHKMKIKAVFERRKVWQIPRSSLRAEKFMKHENNVDTNCNWSLCSSPLEPAK